MAPLPSLGKVLVILGIVLVILGLILWGKIPFLGRFPGDIRIEKDGFIFYFPLTTVLIISAVASLILFLLHRR
jgi:uncharacterized protein HemY